MSAWTNGIVVAIVSYILHHRSTEKAKRKGDEVIFRPRLVARIVYFAGTPFFTLASVAALFDVPGDRQWFVSMVFVVFAVLGLYSWPGIIIVDKVGVRRVWLGIHREEMSWTEIRTAVYIQSESCVVLKAADGQALRTSFLHVDPQALINELSKHVRVDVSEVRYV
jgi:hypothetical protein